LSGKEIQVVLNSLQNVGAHQSDLDVSTLNSGIYVCKMSIGDEVVIQRILVTHD